MASWSWWPLCVALSIVAVPMTPLARQPATPKSVALVLLERGSPDRALIDGFIAALAEIDRRAETISITAGRQLDERLGRPQRELVVACGADLRCIAAIGERAAATHVLLGRAMAQAHGVEIQWLLVDVRTARTVGKFQAKLTDSSEVAPAAAQTARQLLGVDSAELVPRSVQDRNDVVRPGGIDIAGAAPAKPSTDTVASRSAASTALSAPESRTEGRSFWSSPPVVGAAIAGGVLAIAAGVYFTQRAHPVLEIARDLRGTTPRTALVSDRRSRIEGRRRTVLFAAGGLGVPHGAAGWGDHRIAPVVSFDAHVRMAGLSARW